MKSKRLLSLVLMLCILISVMAPAANALQIPVGNIVTGESFQGGTTASKDKLNNLIVSGSDANKGNTLKDDLSHVDKYVDITLRDGQWIATSIDGTTAVLTDAQLPDHIKKLREAADKYTVQELVPAFIVLEADPTSEQYSDINAVPDSKTAALTQQQNDLIAIIEEQILGGNDLTVISQFTYLTNSVVVQTQFGNLEQIAALDGVKSVFLSPVYSPCEVKDVMYPATVSSTQMTGVANVWKDLGYTGTGMTIAVLDTGLDLDHQSFAADPLMNDNSWTLAYVQSLLDNNDLKCEEMFGKELTAEDLYYNAKVPFAFNYSMGTTNVSHADGIGDHGTHVTGIAAANKVEGKNVVGMAPDAQVIAMKVFNSETGGANMYDIINALEDCMTMGVDVVNMSLGSPAGFAVTEIEEIDSIYARISETDIIVDVAAGNEATSSFGSGYGYYMQTTENIDNATISSPSTYMNVLSIASVDNMMVAAAYFTLADDHKVFYMPSVEYHYGYMDYNLEILAGDPVDYVIVPGLGEEADFYDENGNSIVAGKVAVVSRGAITFGEKCFNAQNAGAVAVLIWNNVSEDIFNFGLTTTITDDEGNEVFPSIPVALITLEDGQKMADAQDKTMDVAEQAGMRNDPNGGQMSQFSCWGVSPELYLLPDMAGVGGNVYSCYDGSNYGIMSGTSMATPQVVGVTALVLQYLKEQFPEADAAKIRELTYGLLMSTAIPVIDNQTNLEASPRQQGAGLVDAQKAISAGAYLTVPTSDRPKAELFDSVDGKYSFTFTVHNFSKADKTYTLSSSLLCEDYVTDEAYPGIYFMAEYDHALDNSAVTFDNNSVTVPAGGTAEVTVTIDLTEADKEWIDTYFPSGNYVEGFVYLEGEGEVTLSLPFLGFYGRWDAAPLFDTGFWYDEGFWSSLYEDVVVDSVEANEYYHVLWTSISGSDWVLGLNPYSGVQIGEDGKILYSSDNNVLSPNGDGMMDQFTEFYISLMRNAEELTFTYTDEEGNILHELMMDKMSKTMYISGYGGVVPFVYSWYYDGIYDFTDENGNYLPDGSTVYLEISGAIAYEGAQTDVLAKFPIHIDTSAPELHNDNIVETTDEEGNHYLTLTFTEEHPAFLATMNLTGTQLYKRYYDQDMVKNADGSYSITIDVTGLGDNFSITLCDYACNEASYALSWSETGANNPEVDYDALYAYQVFNEYIQYYYGWDYMFGWSTIDKANGTVEMLQSDIYEYYALNAAEYAGGYVFAVDAGYNFLYMLPGLWNRNTICNLGVNVLDMAFDDVTDTMYLVTKTDDDYALYTIDLLTGDLTRLHTYESQYEMPWAMTFVDGKLYCCKYYYNGFYEVDLEGGSYELSEVLTEDGSAFVPKNSKGSGTSAYYSQSMTYSEKDGLIYWTFFGNDVSDLIVIDPKTWTSTATSFGFQQEYVGVLTLDEHDYVLPETQKITKLVIDKDQIILAAGNQETLQANPLPWNAPADKIVWTSSNEAVATVNEHGVVTALSEGEANITATCEGLSVTCNVVVVDVSGDLHAYNYYSSDGTWGNWLTIDLNEVSITEFIESPVDFIAADYNGHKGLIYGFDEQGQCYSFDPATGECIELGNGGSKVPSDMAYDYSTGIMYAAVYDYNSWRTDLCAVSPASGELIKIASVSGVYMTLACDMEGVFYGITYEGQLDRLTLDGTTMTAEFIMQTPVETLFYAQSMCYDHVNDVLLWANPELSSIFWIDPHASTPYVLSLGEPSGMGYIEYVGMHVIPEEMPALPTVKVNKLSCQDMIMLVGETVAPPVTVYPTNATVQDDLVFISRNTDVVQVVDGQLLAVGTGTATINVRNSKRTANTSFTVTVKEATGDLHAFLLSDLATMDGFYWINMEDSNPRDYEGVEYVLCNGKYMILYAAEHVNGYIYAYGYDYNDWNANFHYMIIDAETRSVIWAQDMGDNFGFVYDMAFDYTTGTMYALCGPSDSASDLYYVNMETGELIGCMATDPMFMSLAIDENGTIYAMEGSNSDSGELDSAAASGNATLYVLDVENGTWEVLMDTGVPSNMLASMAYDYDTGYIYWTGLAQNDTGYQSGLYLIDLEELACYNLGTIGRAGAQVTSLISFCENYPQIPDTLQGMTIVGNMMELAVGDSDTLDVFLQPAGLDVELNWTSADPSIATVDENGKVTAVSAGITTVTVTAYSEGTTFTSSCEVICYGSDDYFLTYNNTDKGFTAIFRPDATQAENLTSNSDLPAVESMAMVDGVIYGYDTEGNLFKTSVNAGFDRTYIGHTGVEIDPGYTEDSVNAYYEYHYVYEYDFVIRDMAWDAVNNRLLALGCQSMLRHAEMYTVSTGEYTYYTDTYELTGGCKIYEVNLETGELTELLTVGGTTHSEPGVTMFEIASDGTAYVYSYYMDYVSLMDMQNGELTFTTTFQNQGVYGDSDGQLMAMTYDEMTDRLYMLFTQNGKIYYLYHYDRVTGAINLVDTVGNLSGKMTDSYSGLILNQPHECQFDLVENRDATCTVPGGEYHICSACGNHYIVNETPALGHEVENGVCIHCDTAFVLIEEDLSDVTAHYGQKVTISVSVKGEGLTYEWYYANGAGKPFKLTETFTGDTYEITMTPARDGRQIYCVITDENGYSVKTNTITLSLLRTDLELLVQPEDILVNKGDKATITLDVQGDGLTYRWYYSDDNGAFFKPTATFTDNFYSVTMTAARDGRQVYCVITDVYGNEIKTDVVTLRMTHPVQITKQPVSVHVAFGEMAMVTVEAIGDGLTYEWFYSYNGKFYKTDAFSGNVYYVSMNEKRDGRQVYCVITDAYGNQVATEIVTLNMKQSLSISSQPESVTVKKGDKATVSVKVTGDGLTYQWYYSDNGGLSFKKTDAFTGDTYSLKMTEARAGRQVYCVITDAYGNVVKTDVVTLGMTDCLKILSQPESVTVKAGEKAVVSVNAYGEGLTYTWYYSDNGGAKYYVTTAFTGDTYYVPMTAARDGRLLYCVITDANGNSVTTEVVTINMAK